jgi:hypothetical protein
MTRKIEGIISLQNSKCHNLGLKTNMKNLADVHSRSKDDLEKKFYFEIHIKYAPLNEIRVPSILFYSKHEKNVSEVIIM